MSSVLHTLDAPSELENHHHVQQVDVSSDEFVVQGLKISHSDQPKNPSQPNRPPSISIHPDDAVDAASVHSLPVAHVTQPPPPPQPRRPSTARAVESVDRPPHSPLPSSRSQTPQEDASLQRRGRGRVVFETRSSSRLSGFLSNLIHRRDYPGPGSGTPRGAVHEDPSVTGQAPSRTSSPPARPITPPPSLPPPSLQELGLSLSITSDISPTHYTSPPSSGAFLAPHYLLLCHAQGLDVLPLVSPPAPQPYALVRRVSFKSVVVMEYRGVLVAVAGRRDGVRVYALEEVKKAIEWRMDVEVKRERDRSRREALKKLVINSSDDNRGLMGKVGKASLSAPPPEESIVRNGGMSRKSSFRSVDIAPTPPPMPPLIPRSPVPHSRRPRARTQLSEQVERPPPYSRSLDMPDLPLQEAHTSVSSSGCRRGSVAEVLAAAPSIRHTEDHGSDLKANWVESSDDEAINIVAAGSSGSQALDERTSGRPFASASSTSLAPVHSSSQPSTTPARRRGPSNLDLTVPHTVSPVTLSEPPSPAPTLLTLRQALSQSPPMLRNTHTTNAMQDPITMEDEDDDDNDGRISLAQALLESRLPDLPPVGTRLPQQPILISASHSVATGDDDLSSLRTSGTPPPSIRYRRRWSIIVRHRSPSTSEASPSSPSIPSSAPPIWNRSTNGMTGPQSALHHVNHPSVSSGEASQIVVNSTGIPEQETTPSIISSRTTRSSRFLPRVITDALQGRRSSDRSPASGLADADSDNPKKINGTPLTPHTPPPKLEYVKLPGTKGSLIIKAVETAKKSFLAILCGENGEKVELFAGTYRTALGLSRTFILPDSPRSLELQLQGDDLVEVFLVFSQNVFGLEPATVRVREVRIGRAERRAARRRAREMRAGAEASNNEFEAALAEEDTNVSVNIGVSVTVGAAVVGAGGESGRPSTPPFIPNEHPDDVHGAPTPNETNTSSATPNSGELLALATAQIGPYTTFQQLNFAPEFPLASIADDYIIPPTYQTFLEYRATHEPDEGNQPNSTQIQFTPPGLPIPVPTAPSRWYYRDPKNVVHGPWKAALMQAWYKDGLLPPDLPVRREEDEEYTLLKDLRLQCVDPTNPFRSANVSPTGYQEAMKPLLSPISLLSQPRHFGPPALFFSSRGGHSTAIVDSRGRSVLKDKFVWSSDFLDDASLSTGRMGDVKRLEAFDVQNRAVLVAFRQGGLEAVDLSDALLKPADESRTILPHFSSPPSSINRRQPFVWKIGSPISLVSMSAPALSTKGKESLNPAAAKTLSGVASSSQVGKSETTVGDVELGPHDEVFFVGRKDDEIYFCERSGNSFRILRLSPTLQ